MLIEYLFRLEIFTEFHEIIDDNKNNIIGSRS